MRTQPTIDPRGPSWRGPPAIRLACLALVLCLGGGCGATRRLVQPVTVIQAYAHDRPVIIACELVGEQLTLPVLIDGQRARLLVDTGADGMLIRADHLAALGLRQHPDRWIHVTGAFGSQAVRGLETFTVEIEGVALLTLADAPVADGDRRRRCAGLLGLDVLRRLEAVIDLGQRTITFPVLPPVPAAAR